MVGLVALMAGCGGTQTAAPPATGVALPMDIREYVGDGHGGAKTLPDLLGIRPPEMQTQTVPTLLRVGTSPLLAKVPQGQINWFRLPAARFARTWVLTLQQLGGADTDLYAFEGPGNVLGDGLAALAFSNRQPGSDSDTVDGDVPDWLSIPVVDSGGHAAAMVAVYGAQLPVFSGDFTLEADNVFELTPEAAATRGTTVGGDSRWYRFRSRASTTYQITLTNVTRNPDMYVYRKNALGYTVRAVGTTSAVLFAAPEADDYYVRIFANAIGQNSWSIRVTTP